MEAEGGGANLSLECRVEVVELAGVQAEVEELTEVDWGVEELTEVGSEVEELVVELRHFESSKKI